MNMSAFTGKQQACPVSNLEGIKFRRLLCGACLLAPVFMTPASELDVRGNICVIIPVLFLMCWCTKEQN